MKNEYYRLDNILKQNAEYNVIYGERSNGKTYSVLDFIVERYFENDEIGAYVRRFDEDLKGSKGQRVFGGIIRDGLIEKYSKGKYNDIYYYGRNWYFCYTTEDGEVTDKCLSPFCYGFSLTNMEHYKSNDYNCKNIFFDEFLTKGFYLNDEFVIFMNLLSTIIRLRNDVKIFMCGNTISRYAPYWAEMGIDINKIKKGEIQVYTYGNSTLKVAVEFSDTIAKKKQSNKYFAFNNPKLNMITGNGSTWEFDIYPHLPMKYTPKDIKFKYYIEFNRELFQCEIISKDNIVFTYIHRKTSEIKEDENVLVYSDINNVKPNYSTNILVCTSKIHEFVTSFFKKDKVYYQDNEVGDTINSYIQQCRMKK